ncbi:MAG: hypothetical protein GXP62_16430 [Oligoflexia bacterium]|nr:hypothetical protein [Oligoflexia bacterium]
MSPDLYALAERLHGHVAVLGLAVLIHPLLSLRRRAGLSRGTLLSATLAAVLVLVSTLSGWLIYPTYRGQVKPNLVHHNIGVARHFESKEHLAFFTMALVIGGVLVLWTAGRSAAGRSAAWWLLAAGLLCGLLTGGLGIWVASGAAPAW